mmetsp:Transcript_33921/g.99968  ORF Transcript_33921/g.99968 Transcript_33921/m.99968 type:complete len:442 (-) Transcript_33921:136-1461(-)
MYHFSNAVLSQDPVDGGFESDDIYLVPDSPANPTQADPPHAIKSLGLYDEDNNVDYMVMTINDAGYNGNNRFVAYDPELDDARWTVFVENAYGSGQPAVSSDGSMVYVSSRGPANTAISIIQAINADTGDVAWEQTLEGLKLNGFVASPDGNTLYVFSVFQDGHGLNALLAFDASSGEEVSRYTSSNMGRVFTNPTMSGSGDAVYGVDDELGMSKFSTADITQGPLWTTKLPSETVSQQTFVRPVLSPDGLVIYTTARSSLARVDTATGGIAWEKRMAGNARGDPQVSNDGSALYVVAGGENYGGPSSTVTRFDATNGDALWDLQPGYIGAEYSLSADGTSLYCGTQKGMVYAIDTSVVSTLDPTSVPTSTPTIASTSAPTSAPISAMPTKSPTVMATTSPTASPTENPTAPPSAASFTKSAFSSALAFVALFSASVWDLL